MQPLRKFVSGAVVADVALGDRQIRVIASDATPDRVKDVMLPSGCKLDNFRQNPIVLAGHDPDKPIGTAEIFIKDSRVEAVINFAPPNVSKTADEFCGLAKAGVLNAVSVGFNPIEAEPIRGGGICYKAWELMELSMVSVPCNPSALVINRSFDSAQQTNKADDDNEWKVGASRNLPLDEDSSWDGPAAEKSIFEHCEFDGDKPNTSYARKAFLFYDAANPTKRESYKEPFAKVVESRLTAVATGIRAAASRLTQTDVPDDAQKKARAVIDHYEAKMSGKSGKSRNKQIVLGKNGKPKVKGLYECAELAQVLAHLGWIHDSAEWEAEVEQDASKLPGMLASILTDVASALVAMTQEETAELLAGHGIEVLPIDEEYIELAATPQAKALRAAFRKAGRVMSQENMDHLNAIAKCVKGIADCQTKSAKLHDDLHDTLVDEMDHGTSLGEHVKALMKAAKPKDDDSEDNDDDDNSGVADPDNSDQELAADVAQRKRQLEILSLSAPAA
jgi:HK97 family phage prohead protease